MPIVDAYTIPGADFSANHVRYVPREPLIMPALPDDANGYWRTGYAVTPSLKNNIKPADNPLTLGDFSPLTSAPTIDPEHRLYLQVPSGAALYIPGYYLPKEFTAIIGWMQPAVPPDNSTQAKERLNLIGRSASGVAKSLGLILTTTGNYVGFANNTATNVTATLAADFTEGERPEMIVVKWSQVTDSGRMDIWRPRTNTWSAPLTGITIPVPTNVARFFGDNLAGYRGPFKAMGLVTIPRYTSGAEDAAIVAALAASALKGGIDYLH
jgi:hypothetical protein